jgi:hypothetical protein
MLFRQIRQVSNLGESKVEGEFRGGIRHIMNMLLHVVGKDSKSSYSGLAFYMIKKALFIFGKRKLWLKERLAKQI